MTNPLPRGIRPAFPRDTPSGQVRARFLELLGMDRIPGEVDATAETVAEDGVAGSCVSPTRTPSARR